MTTKASSEKTNEVSVSIGKGGEVSVGSGVSNGGTKVGVAVEAGMNDGSMGGVGDGLRIVTPDLNGTLGSSMASTTVGWAGSQAQALRETINTNKNGIIFFIGFIVHQKRKIP